MPPSQVDDSTDEDVVLLSYHWFVCGHFLCTNGVTQQLE